MSVPIMVCFDEKEKVYKRSEVQVKSLPTVTQVQEFTPVHDEEHVQKVSLDRELVNPTFYSRMMEARANGETSIQATPYENEMVQQWKNGEKDRGVTDEMKAMHARWEQENKKKQEILQNGEDEFKAYKKSSQELSEKPMSAAVEKVNADCARKAVGKREIYSEFMKKVGGVPGDLSMANRI